MVKQSHYHMYSRCSIDWFSCYGRQVISQKVKYLITTSHHNYIHMREHQWVCGKQNSKVNLFGAKNLGNHAYEESLKILKIYITQKTMHGFQKFYTQINLALNSIFHALVEVSLLYPEDLKSSTQIQFMHLHSSTIHSSLEKDTAQLLINSWI